MFRRRWVHPSQYELERAAIGIITVEKINFKNLLTNLENKSIIISYKT